VAVVDIAIDTENALTLMFDPEHAWDDRIAMEQFAV
jgi:NAD+ kinase